MAYMISNILNDVRLAKDKKTKIEILKANDSPTLREILKIVFDGIQCSVTDVMLKMYDCRNYTFSGLDASISPSNLYREYRNLFIFYKQTPPVNITPKDLAKRWYYMMMLLSRADAMVLESWRYGKFQEVYDITPDVVYYAFPNLIKYKPVIKKENKSIEIKPIDVKITEDNQEEPVIENIIEKKKKRKK